ncbi:MAG: hypothetical protein SOR93_02510 [Clostridiales Family XIII bacterium]|nr:hypothetical protein [Clostridia bacterium]MDY3010122.1 hypothetical protein [Clostridiales Family XIII bacterium]
MKSIDELVGPIELILGAIQTILLILSFVLEIETFSKFALIISLFILLGATYIIYLWINCNRRNIALSEIVSNFKKSYLGLYKYLIDNAPRKSYNPVDMKEVSIQYVLKESENPEKIDMNIRYIFEGRNISKKELGQLFLVTALDNQKQEEKIMLKAFDIRRGIKQEVIPERLEEDDSHYKWKLPFINSKLHRNEAFKYEVLIEWNSCLTSADWGFIIIDPLNYAKRCNQIKYEIINKVSNYEMKQIEFKKIDRKSFKSEDWTTLRPENDSHFRDNIYSKSCNIYIINIQP